MMDHMDPFASDTSTHEAFICAMLEADSFHKNPYGLALKDGLDDNGAGCQVHISRGVLGGAHA